MGDKSVPSQATRGAAVESKPEAPRRRPGPASRSALPKACLALSHILYRMAHEVNEAFC